MISGNQSEEYAASSVTPVSTVFSGPTVLRLMLGTALRRYREAAGFKAEEAAEVIRASHSKISRMENGRVAVKLRDIADLLTCYGITGEQERERLLSLARQAHAPGWWQQYTDVLPQWFERYIGLERAASVIRGYEVQFVHGLLQTRAYARSVIKIANAHADVGEIDRRVALRMERQRLLTEPDPPKLWAVLDEAALRRPPDGRAEMRAQLEHLLAVTELPNVTLQIIPFDRGAHSAAGGPFSILRFPAMDVPDVVFLEQLDSAVYLEDPAQVTAYLKVMDQLVLEAATPEASRELLHALLRKT